MGGRRINSSGKGNALLHGLHPAGSNSAVLFLEATLPVLALLSTLCLNLVIHFTDLNVKTSGFLEAMNQSFLIFLSGENSD